MIELHANLYCDRCNATILKMYDVLDENDARRRVEAAEGWGAEDVDGNDVCAKCWRKWDAEHPPRAEGDGGRT